MNPTQKEQLKELAGEANVLFDEPMKKHTTFAIGGNAGAFVVLLNEEKLCEFLAFCKREVLPFFLLGRGSNILVGDNGIDGIVATLGGEFNEITAHGNRIKAGGAATLAAVANTALKHSLAGFEFAAGIPGSTGGAMRMNAGAYGGEMKDITVSVELMDYEGKKIRLSGEEMKFGYRTSVLKEKEAIVLRAEFELHPGSVEEIKAVMTDLAGRRKEKQPLEYPSAGSTFKRPEGNFAGKLITEAGLGGVSIGGAQVSEKHNGFVINTGNATAKDVKELIALVQKKVYENSGIMLEPEVIMIGE